MKIFHLAILCAAFAIQGTASAAEPEACLNTKAREKIILDHVSADRTRGAATFRAIYEGVKEQPGAPLQAMSPALTAYLDAVMIEASDVAKALSIAENGDYGHVVAILRSYDLVRPRVTTDDVLLSWFEGSTPAQLEVLAQLIGEAYLEKLDTLLAAISPEDMERRQEIVRYIDIFACREITK